VTLFYIFLYSIFYYYEKTVTLLYNYIFHILILQEAVTVNKGPITFYFTDLPKDDFCIDTTNGGLQQGRNMQRTF
jgi:hypothetical protein